MKKKILVAILATTLLIAGCSDTANVSAGQDSTMVLVGSGRNHLIYADKDTGVMYLYIGEWVWWRSYSHAQCRWHTENLAVGRIKYRRIMAYEVFKTD